MCLNLINVFCVVWIVCTLTCIHFIVTFLGLVLCSYVGLFKPKKLDIFAASRLALGNMGFVVLTNLSLRYNSVGCYQVLKHLTTPVIVFIEAVFYKIYLERKFYLPLTLVCLGVTIATATDLELNFLGIFFGLTGVIVTSLYQVWCGTLQKYGTRLLFLLTNLFETDLLKRIPCNCSTILLLWLPYF